MQRRSRCVVALLALLAGCRGAPPPPAVDPTSLRKLPAGEVVGFTGRYGSHVWLGIPYAAPPLGELRWSAPAPAPGWQGTRQALESGPACPQFANPLEDPSGRGVVGSEDCLHLEVYAPRRTPDAVSSGDARFPVMLWIHGGPVSGRAGFYDGGRLAATEEVVVVLINYRMGPFGWFHHRALRADAATPAERSGNFALLDQLRALQWVRENIAAFGGDPEKVTVFGEGFGAFSTRNLLLSPLASGLFQRAILQSNPSWAPSPPKTENWVDDPEPGGEKSSNEILAALLVRDGTVADRAGAKTRVGSMGDAEIVRYLRGKSARDILAAYVEDPDSHQGGYRLYNGVHDGIVLPAEPPMRNLARGDYHHVPVMLGTTRDESKLTMVFDREFVEWRLGLLPRALDPDRYVAAAKHHADACKAGTVDAPAALLHANQGASVYAFRLDWDEEPRWPWLYDGPQLVGAAHGFIGPFVFGHFEVGPQTFMVFGSGSRAGREALSRQMMSYWAAFAERGAPGRGRRSELPEWSPWEPTEGAPKTLLLDTPGGGGLRMTSEVFEVEEVIASLLADPRLESGRERCLVLALWGCVAPAQYDAVESCRSFPRDEFPWREPSEP